MNIAENTSIKELEKELSSIWCKILKLPVVKVNDNFFDLGGHSILLSIEKDIIMDKFNIDISIMDMFSNPTIHSLAIFIHKIFQGGTNDN